MLFLTTIPSDGPLYEIIPDFLYSRVPPVPLRNTADVVVFFEGALANTTQLNCSIQSRGLSPEEVIAALYKDGRRFTELDGHFSAVIVDVQQRALIGITDRQCLGELYYHAGQSGELRITSNFTELLPYSDRRLNENALARFFCLGDVERKDTLVQDIKRIAQFYTLHFDGRLTIRSEYLAELAMIPVRTDLRTGVVLDDLEERLRCCIKELPAADGMLCNTLSGGVDSSYLQALLLEQGHHHSFSIAFVNTGQDNSYAKDVAKYLGTSHRAITFGPGEYLRQIERGIVVTGKPYMNQGEAMFLKLYEAIAEFNPGATIVSGQTADGSLGAALPRTVESALLVSWLPRWILDALLGYRSREWAGLVEALQRSNISSESICRMERRSEFCRRVTRYLGVSQDVYVHNAELANLFTGGIIDKLARAHCYSGEMLRIPNTLYMLARSVGLNVVFPFLNPRVLEYALTVPARLKRRKYAVKKLAERHIPREFVYRPKIDKGIPYDRLFAEDDEWNELICTVMRESEFEFNLDEIIARREYDLVLRLINFHLWQSRVLRKSMG